MRKQLLNECRLSMKLQIPQGTRLIVAEAKPESQTEEQKTNSKKKQEPSAPVLDRKGTGRPYLPGSSVKGVLRSRAEFIANSLNGALGSCHLFAPTLDKFVSDPFGLEAYRRMACGHRLGLRVREAEAKGRSLPESARYRDACPACQLFGHTLWAGRLGVTDFTLAGDSLSLPEYTHNAIDRVTSGVAQGKLFSVRYVSNAVFEGTITIQNFSLWQLGWLGFLIRDLSDGLIAVGHKRTSGAGRVKLQEAAVELRAIAGPQRPPDGRVWGIGRYLSDDIRRAYGYESETHEMAAPGVAWRSNPASIWHTAEPSAAESLELLYRAGPHAAQRLQGFAFIEAMLPASLNKLIGVDVSAGEAP